MSIPIPRAGKAFAKKPCITVIKPKAVMFILRGFHPLESLVSHEVIAACSPHPSLPPKAGRGKKEVFAPSPFGGRLGWGYAQTRASHMQSSYEALALCRRSALFDLDDGFARAALDSLDGAAAR